MRKLMHIHISVNITCNSIIYPQEKKILTLNLLINYPNIIQETQTVTCYTPRLVGFMRL